MSGERRLGPTGGPGPLLRELTLLELVLFASLLGLVALAVMPRIGGVTRALPTQQVEREVRALLRGAEKYAAQRGRWPRSVREMVEAGHYQPQPGVEICRYQVVPGSRRRAPYMLIHATGPGADRVVFTAYPIWGGRLLEYPVSSSGCPEP